MDKYAFIFPGQGAQYIGMGKDIYGSSPEAKKVFDTAQDVLEWDIKKICFEGPEDRLRSTSVCQPAILTVSIACLEVLKSRINISPVFTAGLSLGEYSALVASGVLKFEDVLLIVKKRSELMEEAAHKNPGKMSAIIGLDRSAVEKICLNCGNVSIANLNCPGQVVISGEKDSVDKVKEFSLQKGAKKAIDLDVSGAFHSNLMKDAAEKFDKFLEQSFYFEKPIPPIVSNTDALPKDQAVQFRTSLVRQIYSPVLWEDSVLFMKSKGVEKFFEIGPGRVLRGLIKKIDSSLEVYNIADLSDLEKLVSLVPCN